MTVRLRPHHLLCLLTYVGKGYSRVFTFHYDSVIARLSKGEAVLIISGPDEICFPLLLKKNAHCRRDSINTRDKLAARDISKLLNIAICSGTVLHLNAQHLQCMREKFAQGELREACQGCEWYNFCSTIAADNYKHVCLPSTVVSLKERSS